MKINIKSGDLTLKSHFENRDVRSTHINRTTQNQLIPIICNLILPTFFENVRKSTFYRVLFDQTTDVYHISKLVIFRYDKYNSVREDFSGFC